MNDKGHPGYSRTNVYFTKDDPTLSPDDPRRQFYDRSNAFIPADNFAPDNALRTIHDSTGFDRFIQDGLEEVNFHRYADALAEVIINLTHEGNGFPVAFCYQQPLRDHRDSECRIW